MPWLTAEYAAVCSMLGVVNTMSAIDSPNAPLDAMPVKATARGNSATGANASASTPVSYTHLDVYKRQLAGFAREVVRRAAARALRGGGLRSDDSIRAHELQRQPIQRRDTGAGRPDCAGRGGLSWSSSEARGAQQACNKFHTEYERYQDIRYSSRLYLRIP